MYPTLQGEGYNTGAAVVLLRFEGCNLDCDFCDTDFTGTSGPGGGIWSEPEELADRIEQVWTGSTMNPSVLCTGGEPLLQLDDALIKVFRDRNFRILLETNGTIPVPSGIHWTCVSPKSNEAAVKNGNEVKLVWPFEKTDPDLWVNFKYDHFWLQPLFNENYRENLSVCIRKCLEDPRWRLSLQTHRYTGMP